MSKRNAGMLLLLVALGAIYLFNFSNVFQKQEIEIASRLRPPFARRGKPVASANVMSFSLNNNYLLTSVKVVEEQEFKTNKYPHAVWHLISDSNSVPTKTILYGVTVPGMKPKLAKVKPETLRTNVPYVLLLEAGKLKGRTVFQIR